MPVTQVRPKNEGEKRKQRSWPSLSLYRQGPEPHQHSDSTDSRLGGVISLARGERDDSGQEQKCVTTRVEILGRIQGHRVSCPPV